jgi:hypothetical protein
MGTAHCQQGADRYQGFAHYSIHGDFYVKNSATDQSTVIPNRLFAKQGFAAKAQKALALNRDLLARHRYTKTELKN